MTEEKQGGKRKLKRLWLALAVLAVILAILIVPPLLSVNSYKARITQLMSASLGRPVRLSSVEVRVLPRPGFVLTDLTVDEDPAYGAEPVLHANTVTAYIRLLSLWRGRLEIGTISVDEASLNLVRNASGHWNLDPLLRTAAAKARTAAGGGGPRNSLKLPYLEATSSRINIKNGAEKLPFSLLNADLSFWQESPGDWRVRLRGEPARTDLSLNQADTGVVRLEASMRQAAQMREVPIHLDVSWREAQLGQLTRLILGSDAGWRGDLTGELHLDGTAEAAQIKTRLRATGVHRAEFAPAAPMDFDANCSLAAHFSNWAVENLICDSPLGSGRMRLTGDLPAGQPEGAVPHFSVELDKIPVAAGLDALRTVRSGLGPGIVAAGLASGKITYTPAAASATPEKPAPLARSHSAKAHPAAQGPLAGSFIVEGFALRGAGLSSPIQVPKVVLEPVAADASQPQALAATVAFPAGGSGQLTVVTRLALSGYQLTVRGQATVARARELAHLAGMADAAVLDNLAGDPVTVDLTAAGPWMPAAALQPGSLAGSVARASVPAADADSLTGTVTVRNANWKADYLANHVEISQATLHMGPEGLRWDPVAFSYGPVKGTAILNLPAACPVPENCPPRFMVQFGALDSGVLQAAFLGAHEPGTMLSTLIERLRPTTAPAWPRTEGTIKADSLVLGPVTLHSASASVVTSAKGAEITAFDAGLLGGHVHGTGTFHASGTATDKPAYTLEGQFEKLSPPALGQLLGERWTGGAFDGDGKLELTGFTGSDLAASAKGSLRFEWQHGAVSAQGGAGSIPAALARFDRWTAEAEIANGILTLKQNQVKRGAASVAVQGAVTLADAPKAVFIPVREAQAKR